MGAYSNKLTLSSLRIMKKSKKRNIWLEINVQPKVVSFFFLFLFKGMFKPVLAGLKITLETWNNHCFQWWFCCTKRESHLLFCSKDIYRIFYQFLSCQIPFLYHKDTVMKETQTMLLEWAYAQSVPQPRLGNLPTVS